MKGRLTLCSHLMSEDLDELHEFAQSIGLKHSWFQGDSTWPHYDLLGKGMIEKARAAGAVEQTAREQMVRCWGNKYPGCVYPNRE